MYDSEIKLSNLCGHWFEYYYRKHQQQVELQPSDKKLSKMMDNELLQYFSNVNNIRKYINTLLIDMFTNKRNFYALSYFGEKETEVKELLKICENDLETLNFVVADLTEKNLIAVNNSIEIYKSNNGGTLETKEESFYQYMTRKLGIESTYDSNYIKNKKLKQKIIDERYFSDYEIKIISKFADTTGYGWMLIWKNINNVKVIGVEELSSGFENETKGYVGKMSGNVVVKEKFSIKINDILFTTIKAKSYDTSGFW